MGDKHSLLSWPPPSRTEFPIMAAAKTTRASDNDVHEAAVSVYIRPPLSQPGLSF